MHTTNATMTVRCQNPDPKTNISVTIAVVGSRHAFDDWFRQTRKKFGGNFVIRPGCVKQIGAVYTYRNVKSNGELRGLAGIGGVIYLPDAVKLPDLQQITGEIERRMKHDGPAAGAALTLLQ